MTTELLLYSQLVESDIEKLATVLHHQSVYEHIGGMPSRADFDLSLCRALAGPLTNATGEHWINVAVRVAENGELIGRLEANVHDRLAEVAFLYNPRLWGRGYALRGLLWLHDHLRQDKTIESLWGATHPRNQRSASLLLKCGYTPAETQDLPVLYSYDEGDDVFKRRVVF